MAARARTQRPDVQQLHRALMVLLSTEMYRFGIAHALLFGGGMNIDIIEGSGIGPIGYTFNADLIAFVQLEIMNAPPRRGIAVELARGQVIVRDPPIYLFSVDQKTKPRLPGRKVEILDIDFVSACWPRELEIRLAIPSGRTPHRFAAGRCFPGSDLHRQIAAQVH